MSLLVKWEASSPTRSTFSHFSSTSSPVFFVSEIPPALLSFSNSHHSNAGPGTHIGDSLYPLILITAAQFNLKQSSFFVTHPTLPFGSSYYVFLFSVSTSLRMSYMFTFSFLSSNFPFISSFSSFYLCTSRLPVSAILSVFVLNCLCYLQVWFLFFFSPTLFYKLKKTQNYIDCSVSI